MAYEMGKAEGTMDINITGAKSALKEVKQSLKEVKEASDSTKDSLKGTGKQLEDTGSSSTKASKGLLEASESFKKSGDKIKKAGKDITKVGSTLVKGVTLPIVGVGAAFIKISADFEQSMANVSAISGATGSEFESLRDKAKELGASTEYSALQVSDAFSYMGMAGWDAGKMIDGIAPMLDLATAAGMDLARASDIVTDGISAFGLEAKDTKRFCDALAVAATSTNTTVEQLGESFTYVAPVAGAAGYSVEDVTLALGLMANTGIKASQSGTAFRRMITEMQGGVELTGKELGKFHVEVANVDGSLRPLKDVIIDMRQGFDQMTAAEKLSNSEMLSGKTGMAGLASVMTASQEDFDKLVENLSNTSGASSSMADIMRDTTSNSVEAMKSAMEGLALSCGEILLPIFRDFVEMITKLVDKFNSFDESQKKMILGIAAVAAVIPPIIMLIGSLISNVGTITGLLGGLMGAIAAIGLPVVGVVAGITALIAVIIKLWKDGSGAVENLKELVGKHLAQVGKQFNKLKEQVIEAWENIKPQLQSFWLAVENLYAVIAPIIDAIVDLFFLLLEGVMAVVGGIVDGFDNLIGMVTGAINILTGLLRATWALLTGDFEGFKAAMSVVMNNILKMFSEGFNGIRDFIKGILSNIGTNFTDSCLEWIALFEKWIDDSIKQFTEFGRNLIDGLVGGIRDAKDKAVQAVKDVGSGLVNGFKNLLGIHSPSRVFSQLGKYIDQGLERGLLDNQWLPVKAMDRIAQQITSSGNTISKNLITVNKETGSIIFNNTYDRVNKTIDLYYKEKDKRVSLMNKGTDENIKAIDREISATQKAYDIKMKLLEQEYLAKTKLIDDESAKQIEELQSQLDAMDALKEQESRDEEDKSYQDELALKKKALDEYEGDYEGYLKLKKDLDNMQAQREKVLLNRKREDEKKALREQMDEIRKKAQADKDAIQEAYEAKKMQLEQQKADEIAYLTEMQRLLKDDYDKRRELEEVQTKIKNKEGKKQTKEEKKELKTREMELQKSLGINKVNLEGFSKETGRIAEEAGQLFAKGFRSTEHELKRYLDDIVRRADEARRAVDSAIEASNSLQGAPNTMNMLGLRLSTNDSLRTYNSETEANARRVLYKDTTKVTGSSVGEFIRGVTGVNVSGMFESLKDTIRGIERPSVTVNSEFTSPKALDEREIRRQQEDLLRKISFDY